MSVLTIGYLEAKIRSQEETIKGLDRVNAGYSQEIVDKDKIIKALNERIAYITEAQASVPTPDINGTIEAQRGLISKIKRDVLTLQAKVQEQDERLKICLSHVC